LLLLVGWAVASAAYLFSSSFRARLVGSEAAHELLIRALTSNDRIDKEIDRTYPSKSEEALAARAQFDVSRHPSPAADFDVDALLGKLLDVDVFGAGAAATTLDDARKAVSEYMQAVTNGVELLTTRRQFVDTFNDIIPASSVITHIDSVITRARLTSEKAANISVSTGTALAIVRKWRDWYYHLDELDEQIEELKDGKKKTDLRDRVEEVRRALLADVNKDCREVIATLDTEVIEAADGRPKRRRPAILGITRGSGFWPYEWDIAELEAETEPPVQETIDQLQRARRYLRGLRRTGTAATLVIGAVLAILIGFSNTYLATPTWGQAKDIISTLTWSVGVAGAVNVARALTLRADQVFAGK